MHSGVLSQQILDDLHTVVPDGVGESRVTLVIDGVDIGAILEKNLYQLAKVLFGGQNQRCLVVGVVLFELCAIFDEQPNHVRLDSSIGDRRANAGRKHSTAQMVNVVDKSAVEDQEVGQSYVAKGNGQMENRASLGITGVYFERINRSSISVLWRRHFLNRLTYCQLQSLIEV